MIIVSDTSPISNLLKVDLLEILHSLFSSVIIPTAVKDELVEGFGSNPDLKAFLSESWVQIITPTRSKHLQQLLHLLDPGESEAIALAKEMKADRLLIDEADGRKIALSEGFHIIGTAGTLLLAKKNKLIEEVKPILHKLITSEGYWLNEKIYFQILTDAEE